LMPTCKLRFFVIYRPPYRDLSATKYVDSLIRCFEQHCSNNYVNIVAGDFNCPNINWADHSAPNDYVNQSILNWAVSYGFVQYVNFSTRGQNILDLVLTDDDQIISDIADSPPIGLSDHCVVDFVLNVVCNADCNYYNCNSENTKKYKWYEADVLCMEQHLNSINWNDFICHNSSVALAWSAFIDLLWDTVDEFVPYSVTRVQPGKP